MISQLLSACPGTVRECEANEGNLKLTSVVWYGNTNEIDPNRVYIYQVLLSHYFVEGARCFGREKDN